MDRNIAAASFQKISAKDLHPCTVYLIGLFQQLTELVARSEARFSEKSSLLRTKDSTGKKSNVGVQF